MTIIPSFLKMCQLIQELKWCDTETAWWYHKPSSIKWAKYPLSIAYGWSSQHSRVFLLSTEWEYVNSPYIREASVLDGWGSVSDIDLWLVSIVYLQNDYGSPCLQYDGYWWARLFYRANEAWAWSRLPLTSTTTKANICFVFKPSMGLRLRGVLLNVHLTSGKPKPTNLFQQLKVKGYSNR